MTTVQGVLIYRNRYIRDAQPRRKTHKKGMPNTRTKTATSLRSLNKSYLQVLALLSQTMWIVWRATRMRVESSTVSVLLQQELRRRSYDRPQLVWGRERGGTQTPSQTSPSPWRGRRGSQLAPPWEPLGLAPPFPPPARGTLGWTRSACLQRQPT